MKIFSIQNLYKVVNFAFRLWCLTQILTGSQGSQGSQGSPSTQERINNLKKYQDWIGKGNDKNDFKGDY